MTDLGLMSMGAELWMEIYWGCLSLLVVYNLSVWYCIMKNSQMHADKKKISADSALVPKVIPPQLSTDLPIITLLHVLICCMWCKYILYLLSSVSCTRVKIALNVRLNKCDQLQLASLSVSGVIYGIHLWIMHWEYLKVSFKFRTCIPNSLFCRHFLRPWLLTDPEPYEGAGFHGCSFHAALRNAPDL